MMKIQCTTEKGGSVQLNKGHGVWASYAVTGVADLPRREILFAGITLPNGRQVQFFANRETGLVVVDIVTAGQCGGNEVLRLDANAVPMPIKRGDAA